MYNANDQDIPIYRMVIAFSVNDPSFEPIHRATNKHVNHGEDSIKKIHAGYEFCI